MPGHVTRENYFEIFFPFFFLLFFLLFFLFHSLLVFTSPSLDGTRVSPGPTGCGSNGVFCMHPLSPPCLSVSERQFVRGSSAALKLRTQLRKKTARSDDRRSSSFFTFQSKCRRINNSELSLQEICKMVVIYVYVLPAVIDCTIYKCTLYNLYNHTLYNYTTIHCTTIYV